MKHKNTYIVKNINNLLIILYVFIMPKLKLVKKNEKIVT